MDTVVYDPGHELPITSLTVLGLMDMIHIILAMPHVLFYYCISSTMFYLNYLLKDAAEAQSIECLPIMHKAPNSIRSTA